MCLVPEMHRRFNLKNGPVPNLDRVEWQVYDYLHPLGRMYGVVGSMREQLGDAALIALLGVTVVMVALAILMLAIMLMTRLFPGKKDSGDEEMTKVMRGDEPTKESVAAIAVAVALAMKEQGAGNISGHAESPVSGPVPSRWSAAGRERLMGSKRNTEQRWGKPSR
jgi:Na+-transporting methylmalonyl-CoA/oxaloacetate decarboxylase gamma subunit